jgi:hypothetical protein
LHTFPNGIFVLCLMFDYFGTVDGSSFRRTKYLPEFCLISCCSCICLFLLLTFIGYAQSRKVRKTNNLRQEWLLREKGKFKSLDVTAICPSLLYSGIRAGSIQIYTLVSYVRTMDSPKLLYSNTLITYNRSKTLKKLEN